MVITCEPGLYIPNIASVPEEFRNIGVRLEDNIRIDSEPDNMTKALPRHPDDLKKLIGK